MTKPPRTVLQMERSTVEVWGAPGQLAITTQLASNPPSTSQCRFTAPKAIAPYGFVRLHVTDSGPQIVASLRHVASDSIGSMRYPHVEKWNYTASTQRRILLLGLDGRVPSGAITWTFDELLEANVVLIAVRADLA